MSNASEWEELRRPSSCSLSASDLTPLAPVTATATESDVSLNSLEVRNIMQNSNTREINSWGWDPEAHFTPRSASFEELCQNRSNAIQEMFNSVRPEQEGANPTTGRIANLSPETEGRNAAPNDPWRVTGYDSADDNDLSAYEEAGYEYDGTEPSLLLMERVEVGPGHSATSGSAGNAVTDGVGVASASAEGTEPDSVSPMDPISRERFHRAIRAINRSEIMTRTIRHINSEITREAVGRPLELSLEDEDVELADGIMEIRYGNRSFEPMSNFSKVASKQALPAKPGVSRFITCDEKAEAARQVYHTIQTSTVGNDGGGAGLLAYNTDVFNHFWSETNVLDVDPSESSHATPTPGLPDISTNANRNRNRASRSRRSDSAIRRNFGSGSGTIDFGRIMTTQEYDQWDLETSTTMDASFWNDLSIRQSSTRIGNPSFDSGICTGGDSEGFSLSNRSTVGVGTNCTGEEFEADLIPELSTSDDDDNDEDSPRDAEVLSQPRARRFHRGRRALGGDRRSNGWRERNGTWCNERNLSPPTRDFYRSIGLIVDNGDHRGNVSPFTLNVPAYPRRINRPQENSPRPMSFLAQLSQDRGDGNIHSGVTIGNHNNNNGGDDDPWKVDDENDSDDGESVFPRVPQADARPSALFSGMIEHFEGLDIGQAHQQQQLTAAESNSLMADIDEIFFLLEQNDRASGNNVNYNNAERHLEIHINAPQNCERSDDVGPGTFDREE